MSSWEIEAGDKRYIGKRLYIAKMRLSKFSLQKRSLSEKIYLQKSRYLSCVPTSNDVKYTFPHQKVT